MVSAKKPRVLISYKIFSEVASRAFSFLLVVLAARLLSKSDFGTFSLAWAVGWVAAVFSDFGLQLHLAREVARHPDSARTILGSLIRWKVFLGVSVLGILVFAWLWLGPSENSWAFFLLVTSQLLISFVDFLNHYFRGLSRSEIESTTNLVHRFISMLGGGGILWLEGGLLGCGAALLAGAVMALGWTVWITLRFPLEPKGSVNPFPWAAPGWRDLLRRVFPIGAGIVLSTLYFRIDLFLLEWWLGIQAVAVYTAVFRPVDGLRLVPAAAMAVLFPEFCRDSSLRSVRRTGLFLLAISVPVLFLLEWYSELVLGGLYGPDYLSGTRTFRILLLSLPLLYLNFALTHQVLAWARQGAYLILTLVVLGGNLCLNAILIPRLGISGAAWATLGTEIILTLGCVLILAPGGPREADHGARQDEPLRGSVASS